MEIQKAYHLLYDSAHQGACLVDCVSELDLPQVVCEKCGASDSSQHVWYSSVHAQIAQIRKVVSAVGGNSEVVSSGLFEKIRNDVRLMIGRNLWLPGGSHLGRFSITVKPCRRPDSVREKLRRLSDIFECGPNIVLSKKAIDALQEQGLMIPFGPASLTWHGIHVEHFCAIELEPRSLFAASGEEAWNDWACDFCGEWHAKEPRRRGGNPSWVEYDWNLFPNKTGIARLRECHSLIASEEFKNAVEQAGVRGFRFIECGVFVV
jgi:hypothetical protein